MDNNWYASSIKIKSYYKFSIAAENAKYSGYTSEKILTSFLAHTVPIYWGNPYAAEEYNPEAFINCHDYDSFDGVIRRIKEVDENDDLWAYMVSQPWQTEQQRENYNRHYERYRKFFTNIFMQPLHKAVRRPSGTFTNSYDECLERGLPKKLSLPKKIMRLVAHPSKIPAAVSKRIKRFIPALRATDALRVTDIDDFFRD